MAGEAWYCPVCCVGVELGEESWRGTLAPIVGVNEPLHYECGTELVVNPDLGKREPAERPAWEQDAGEAPWVGDPDAWKAGGE